MQALPYLLGIAISSYLRKVVSCTQSHSFIVNLFAGAGVSKAATQTTVGQHCFQALHCTLSLSCIGNAIRRSLHMLRNTLQLYRLRCNRKAFKVLSEMGAASAALGSEILAVRFCKVVAGDGRLSSQGQLLPKSLLKTRSFQGK